MKALREEESYDIPLTSLLDVVFLLLIFFLVATNFIRQEVDHTIALPESESGAKSIQVPSRLVINIRQDRTLVVNGRVMTETDLRHAIGEFVSVHPGRPAVIRADALVPYQAVMRVFGICRRSGVRNIDLPVLEPEAK